MKKSANIYNTKKCHSPRRLQKSVGLSLRQRMFQTHYPAAQFPHAKKHQAYRNDDITQHSLCPSGCHSSHDSENDEPQHNETKRRPVQNPINFARRLTSLLSITPIRKCTCYGKDEKQTGGRGRTVTL